jgi:hypothetical protein
MDTLTRSLATSSAALLRLALVAAPLLAGCGYEEGLLISNLRGTIRIPKTALERTVIVPATPDEAERVEVLVDEPRLIGPVYLGLYPFVHEADVVARYPHPEMGPQYIEDTPGDAYPYGGTTVGDIRFACFEYLSCKVTSGRFLDYDDLVDWFQRIGQPITDASGAVVIDGAFVQQTCYDLLAVTSDEEVRITAEDKDLDGKITMSDLDFQEDGDSWVAPFTLWQQEFFWDVDQEAEKGCTPGTDCTGFTLWGYMDAPDVTNFQFSSCETGAGNQYQRYNTQFFGGVSHNDLLNFPSKYIAKGDWVVTEPYVWKDIYDEPELTLDFLVP